MTKKQICLLLAVVMLVGIFAIGCGRKDTGPGTEATTQPGQTQATDPTEQAADPITFSVFFSSVREDYPGSSRVGDIITNATGVTLQRAFLVGDLETKLGVMIASGDYPDFADGAHMNNLIYDAGGFIPLDDLIEQYGPNIKALYGDWLDRLRRPDGKIYTLAPWVPINEPIYDHHGPAVFIQRAILKEFGYPEVKYWDQYVDLLERYYAKYPQIDGQDTIGFQVLFDGWRDFAVKNAPYHLAGYPNDGTGIVDLVDDKWVFSTHWDKDITKRYMKALNDLYHKGLLDPEGFVINYDTYLERISSGRVLGLIDQRWQHGQAQTVLLNEKPERAFVMLPVVFDENYVDELLEYPSIQASNGIGITINNPDPVRAIQFIDYLAREEIQILLNWGVEGIDYHMDENGRFYRTEEQRVKAKDPNFDKEMGGPYFHGFPFATGTFSNGNSVAPGMQPEERFAAFDDWDKEILQAYGVLIYEDLFTKPARHRKYFPLWTASLEEGSSAQLASVRIGEVTTRFIPMMALSAPGEFETAWEQYMTELNKIDLKAFEQAYQAIIDQRMAEW